MCGICGIVDVEDSPRFEDVDPMTAALAHRGPDMGGLKRFPQCALGHRRLSIIDLSESAGQPMLSEDGETALVFNGEIYNHRELRKDLESKGKRFRTNSDTEVVLQLFIERGYETPNLLNGMFSFAVWDNRRRRLFAARDRLGKKPFYYFSAPNFLAFASELSSLALCRRVPRVISPQALAEFLLYDFIPAPHSIFAEVFKLPPAHYAVFEGNRFEVKRYWAPPSPEPDADYKTELVKLRDLIYDSVRARLISDVPLGAFLSGGVDSTLVTAVMATAGARPPRTFSVSFPGTTHDESAWARLAAKHIGAEHFEHAADYQLETVFPLIVRHFGEPFGDSSALPVWHLCRETRRHVTVALSGDGGDELFAGYDRYRARAIQTVYDRLPAWLREKVVEPLVDRLPGSVKYYGASPTKKAKLFIDAARRMRENPCALIPRTFTLKEVEELTGGGYTPEEDPTLEAAATLRGLDPVSMMQFADMETYLAEDILTKVDRMSMAHALEVRAPLLDYRIVELACRLPLGFKLAGGVSKRILKDAAAELVPETIMRRSKYGFQPPLGLWFKTGLKKWAGERIMDGRTGELDQKAVERLWRDHLAGRADHGLRLWLILVLREWRDQLGSGS
jgi:asparagine synthase (glutamine-hydrolysing)